MRRRWLRLVLGVLLSGGALWLATRGVDWAEVGLALRAADYRFLALAVMVQGVSYLLAALRWRTLFPEPASIPFGPLIEALLVAQLANAALPLRPGPLVRAYLVGEQGGQGITVTLTTVAGEKLLELLALAVALGLLLVLLPIPTWVRQAGMATAVVAAGGLAAVLVLTGHRRRLEGCLVRLGGWASGMGLTMLDSMAPWLQLGRIGQLTWWTAWLWGSGVVINLLVLQALDIPGSPLMALTLLVLLTLGARVPAGPANIGVFESLCVVGLDWFGVKPGLALSYGFALHVVVLLPGLIGGAWVVWHDATIWAGVRGAADREQSGV